MKKNLWIIAIVLVITLVVLTVSKNLDKKVTVNEETPKDHKNISYKIEGKNVLLQDGVSEEEAAPGSASKIVTKYFGNEFKKDIDKDGREDIVFLITQETGGTGKFYYVVGALNKVAGYKGTDAVLLGDRIAPENITSGNGNIVVVNYADRKPGESFDVAPSVGKSLLLLLNIKTMMWGEVANNFEGEADPSKMTLSMNNWNWIYTLYSDNTKITPKVDKKFILTLKTDKTFSAKTDCNSVSGKYTLDGNKIAFTNMTSTLMFCEGSQERDFTKALSAVESYFFTSRGELVFDLKYDSGSMVFR